MRTQIAEHKKAVTLLNHNSEGSMLYTLYMETVYTIIVIGYKTTPRAKIPKKCLNTNNNGTVNSHVKKSVEWVPVFS